MKKIYFILLYLFSLMASAFEVEKVNITCHPKINCFEIDKRLSKLKSRYVSLEHLSEVIKIYAYSENFDYFSYSLTQDDQRLNLNIEIKPKAYIKKFQINSNYSDFEIPMNLPLKAEDYFDRIKLTETIDLLRRQAISNGFTKVEISEDIKQTNTGMEIVLKLNLLNPKILKSITLNTNNYFIKNTIDNRLNEFLNKPFDLQSFRLEIDNIKNYLFEQGYYTLDIELEPIRLNNNEVKTVLNIAQGNLIIFNVVNDAVYDHIYFKDILKNYIRTNRRIPRKDIIRSLLLDYYKKVGFLDADIDVTTSEYKNKNNEDIVSYKINPIPGIRYSIQDIKFTGNNKFSNKKINNIFNENSSELVRNKYMDQVYLENFTEILKKSYISEGFLKAQIELPEYKINPSEKTIEVEYKIRESSQAIIAQISISGVDVKYLNKMKEMLQNKEEGFFNPILFEQDLNEIINFLGERGYYYASIKNKNNNDLLVYSKDASKLNIYLNISTGPKLRLDHIVIVGNRQTKNSFILKNVYIEKNGKIKPVSLKNIQTRLTNTGLFSSVKVEPIQSSIRENKTDILIQVTEKDFGVVELAPGYRTDIGLKLSGTVTYNNIAGVNRTLSLKGQVNQRFNYNTFDKRRRNEKKSMLEYSANINLMERFFLDTQMNYNIGLTTSRKRFYSFDADILRISNTVSQDLTNNISSSLRHQYENIAQFDATEERDNGEFKIGALTPSLTFDYRDNRINTRKGAFSNLSCEYADPIFLSQNTDDLKINYYKFVARNRFYVPYPNGKGVLALSLTGGLQQNLAKSIKTDSQGEAILDDNGNKQTQGYIPNIKVFRLSGTDIVRGYDEDEINRLTNNKDISEETVSDRAYLVNLKVEPRYFLNDSMILGVFYDAGRVYINEVETDELRSSVGLSFKYLTPVGSLDFDYGIKTLRKREPDGSMESPGRLHVSIGFF